MTVVAELFATLGLKVDASVFAKADAALAGITGEVEAVVQALRGAEIGSNQAVQQIGAGFERASAKVLTFTERLEAAKLELLAVAEAEETTALARMSLAGSGDARFAPPAMAAAPHGEGDHGTPAPAGHGGKGGKHGAGGHGGHGRGFLQQTLMNPLQAAAHGFIAAFAVHEIMHFAESISQAGVVVEKMSQQLGITTDAVQELQYVAKVFNVDSEVMRIGLKNLEVQAGNGGKAFKALGINTKDATGKLKPADMLFEDVADKISGMVDPSKQAAAAQAIFGRSGIQLLPMLKKGKEGLEELRHEAEELGLEFDGELLHSNEQFEEGLKKLNQACLGLKGVIGKYLLPALTSVITKFVGAVRWIRGLQKETAYLQTLFAVGLATAALKAGIAIEAAGWKASRAWLAAKANILITAAAFALLALAFEDIYQLITGGESQLGQWIDQFEGFGAVDKHVRDLAAGWKILREEIEHVLALDFSKLAIVQTILHPIDSAKSLMDARKQTMKNAEDRGHREAFEEASKSSDPILAKIGKRNLEQYDRDHFGEGAAVPRALGQGSLAKAEAQRFGIAGKSAVPGSEANGGGPPVAVHVEIHEAQHMKPADIEHHVEAGVHKALSKQAKKVREAHAPATGDHG